MDQNWFRTTDPREQNWFAHQAPHSVKIGIRIHIVSIAVFVVPNSVTIRIRIRIHVKRFGLSMKLPTQLKNGIRIHIESNGVSSDSSFAGQNMDPDPPDPPESQSGYISHR